MKRLSIFILCLGATLCAQAQNPVRIDSSSSVDNRIPIAVPPFAGDASTAQMARDLAGILAYDLEYTGLFSVVQSNQFPANFQGMTQDFNTIDFEAWRGTPAEHLVYAYVFQQGGKIVAQCRLFDVLVSQQIVGQQLETEPKAWRRLAHKFADEIVRFLTGTPGAADSEICFSAGANGKKEIYVADYDGGTVRQATQHSSISIKPKFSPDGRKIAYLSYKDRFPFLYILDLDSGVSTPLSKRVGLNNAPAWAPDSKSLALCLSKDGNTEVYVKNADGSGERRLTNDKGSDTSPCFSPDGGQIAFVSDRGGKPDIWGMAADGGNPHRLSTQGGKSYDPAWSPDGNSIAYVVERSGEGFEIWVMDSNGGNARQLTASGGSNESPSWSPDSRNVVFGSSRSGGWQLYGVTVETGVVHPVPNMSNLRCEGPSWGPRRSK